MQNKTLDTPLSIDSTGSASQAPFEQTRDQNRAAPGSGRAPLNAAAPKKRRKGVVVFGLFLLCGASFAGGAAFYRHYLHTKQVVVAVNGIEITQQDMFDRLEKAGGTQTIRQLVTENIQIAYAKDRNVMPTNEVVAKAVNSALEDPAFRRQVADSPEDLNAYYREVQVNLAKAAVVTQGITVTEPEIRAYYDQNVDKNNPSARFYVPETTTLEVVRNHSQAAIEAADRDLRGGRDFAAVVSDYSTDQSKANQGMTAPLIRGRNAMVRVPGMENAIFNIEIGETYGPHQFAGDWWIFKCVNKTPATTVPYERAHLQSEIGAKMAKVTPERLAAVQEDFQRFQKGVNIQVFWPKYNGALAVH